MSGFSMKKFFSIIILFVLIFSGYVFSKTSVDELFKLANEKYKTGNYQEAIQIYNSILKKGIKNGYIYYNLGNAYFKNKELGKAILNYERAKIYLPDDKDVNYNLKYASLMRIDKFKKNAPNPFTVIIMFIYNMFSVNTLFVFVYLLLLVIIGFYFVKWFWKNNITLNNILYKIFPYTIGLFIFFLFLLSVKIYITETSSYAIILKKEIDVKSGPGKEYTVMFNLHEGTKVSVKKYSGNWMFISTPNGFSGWIEKSSAEKI